MRNWHVFNDSRFALSFKYPGETPQGHLVEQIEGQKNDALRIHFISKERKELYIEVTKYHALPARVEYAQHKRELENRFEELYITELRTTVWKSLPAYEYSFEWSQDARSVILVERNDITYRILYDPRSPLNTQVLSTIEFFDQRDNLSSLT